MSSARQLWSYGGALFLTLLCDVQAFAASGEAEVEGLPQLDPTWYPTQIFWLIVTFSLLYFIFSTKILPDLSTTMERRQSHIQDDLDTADELKKKAESVQKAYEELLNGAHQEALEQIQQNDRAMKDKYQAFLDDFRARSAKEIQKTEKSIADAKVKAMDNMHDVAAELARAAAEKVVGLKPDIKQVKSVVRDIDKKAA